MQCLIRGCGLTIKLNWCMQSLARRGGLGCVALLLACASVAACLALWWTD